MTTIRAYTTIEQSRKLAEILPIESADMNYWCGTQIRIGGHRTMDRSDFYADYYGLDKWNGKFNG